MTSYFLTLEAKLSLEEIKAFSTDKFGEKQTTLYLKKLKASLCFLAENPNAGIERTDLGLSWQCHSYPTGSHIIYYEIKTNRIIIIDILHQAMDPEKNLLPIPDYYLD